MIKFEKPDRDTVITSLLPFIALPACLTGVFTMYYHEVPKRIWIVNLIATGLGILITKSIQGKVFGFKPLYLKITTAISVILLLLTFTNRGIDEVHRWLFVGGLNFNIGLIVCPVLLLLILDLNGFLKPFLLSTSISVILLLQPDASQVSAFSIAALFLLLGKSNNNLLKIFLVGLTLAFNTYTWVHLDGLQPVNYVERVVEMAGEISTYVKFMAFFSLALLPFPFFVSDNDRNRHLAIALGLYFCLSIAASFVGNFPVIIMGYGISPVIGYFMAINWLLLTKRSTKRLK